MFSPFGSERYLLAWSDIWLFLLFPCHGLTYPSLQGRHNFQFPVNESVVWDQSSICPSVSRNANSSCLEKSISMGWAFRPAAPESLSQPPAFCGPWLSFVLGVSMTFWTPRSCLLSPYFLIWAPSYFIQRCLFCFRVFGEEPHWITWDNLICSCPYLLWNPLEIGVLSSPLALRHFM